MLLRRILLSMLAMGSVACGFGQEKAPLKLSFKEAVQIGLKNNVLYNQQKNQLEYTQVNKTSSLLQMGPSASANLNVYRSDGNSFNQQEGRVINGVIDYVGGGVGASMPLFSGLTYLNQFRSANNNNEAQLYKVARSNQDAIAVISNQYLLCLLDQELVKVNQENVRVQKVTYDQIKEQADLGAKAESDVYNQEYLWRSAEMQLINSQNKLKNDLAALAVTLLVDPTVYIEVDKVDWDINELLADSASFDDMYTLALDKRADLNQAKHAEKGAKYFYSARKGYYYPNVFAGINYNSQYNYVQGSPDNRSFNDQFTKDNTQLSYGLNISIPIFNSFIYRTQTAQARVAYKNAELAKTNTEITVKSDIVKAHQNFSDAKRSYLAARAQLTAGEFAYKMEKERYDLGISNIVQLSTVSQSYVKSQGDYQTAVFTLLFQKILLSYAMGTLQIEDIP